MARYTYALRGEPSTPKDEIRVQEEDVNIMHGEQLTEHYLCDINSAGEVPVIAATDESMILPDSLEITKDLARVYPSLIPRSYAAGIERSLSELHSINFFSLTFAGKPQSQEASKGFLRKQLDSNISSSYRKAIEYKLERIQTHKLGALERESSRQNEVNVHKLMQELEANVSNSGSGWCFGLDESTALDAHLVVFIARMHDIHRSDLIPDTLRLYAERAMDGIEWKHVMQGRTTHAPQLS